MRIITICVEFSALIVICGLIYLILHFKANNASLVPLELLVHVYVRSVKEGKGTDWNFI